MQSGVDETRQVLYGSPPYSWQPPPPKEDIFIQSYKQLQNFKEHIRNSRMTFIVIGQHKNNGWEIITIQTILKWFLEYLLFFLYGRLIPYYREVLRSSGVFQYIYELIIRLESKCSKVKGKKTKDGKIFYLIK